MPRDPDHWSSKYVSKEDGRKTGNIGPPNPYRHKSVCECGGKGYPDAEGDLQCINCGLPKKAVSQFEQLQEQEKARKNTRPGRKRSGLA
jgi:hypothetical protein